MKKVIRLNENDIENLVKKIIKDTTITEHVDNYIDLEFEKLIKELEKGASKGKMGRIEKLRAKYDSLTGVDSKKNLVEKIKTAMEAGKLTENERPRGGMMFGDKAEIIDEVINRIGQYGDEYIESLEGLNSAFPVTKYKKIEPSRDIEIPKGVKIQSTVYPTR
jgi:hypothetical protein